jgi:hypothetical protein
MNQLRPEDLMEWFPGNLLRHCLQRSNSFLSNLSQLSRHFDYQKLLYLKMVLLLLEKKLLLQRLEQIPVKRLPLQEEFVSALLTPELIRVNDHALPKVPH